MLEGTTIGAYRVLRKIGEGGMGTVYVGEHTLLGRKAAIKVLLPSLSAHQEIVQRFFNEAKAVTQIADAGIVQVFDFGYHTDGSAFIIMELLEGESMDRRLERIGRFSPTDCLRLMRLICQSLGAAHAKGIVHRDLKPENIYIVGDPAVTGGERAKILDFGIAKLTTDEPGKMKTRTGMVMGTPVYMSPEQCRDAGEVDARADIYSIGCVMMTMLTGRPPFEGLGSGDLIVAHLTTAAPRASSRLPGLPVLFDQILERCLAKAPDDRFPSMLELTKTLGQAEQMMLSAATPTLAGDLAGYLASGLTPPPGTMVLPAPTTLSGATGQAGTPAGTKKRGVAWIGAALAGAALLVGIIVIAVTRGGGDGEPDETSSAAVVAPIAVAVDAAVAPVGTGGVAGGSTVDAGIPDSPAIVEVIQLDAGVAPVKRPRRQGGQKGPKRTTTPEGSTTRGGNDATTGSGSAQPVDRGD